MKFRVTKNESLEKAMNKANLVLVEVPVNTIHGQHRSHRWKRAIDALNQLFEDLGKKANAEDIAFIDKNTNKKVNKDELIKDYKKRGKKENKTLQAFVAENYKVSTKEDGKEEELTVNNKNTGDNKTNETEDIKGTKVPKDKEIVMSSSGRYKKEKFKGTFSCGHKDTIYIGGYSDEYRESEAEERFKGLCPHCQHIETEKQREIERERAKKIADEIGLPKLEGTEKQINWALSIRNEKLEQLNPMIEYIKNNRGNKFNSELLSLYLRVVEDTIKNPDSEYWIDHRNRNFRDSIINDISIFDKHEEKFVHPLSKYQYKEYSLLDSDKDLVPINDEIANEKRKKLCEGINKTGTKYLNNITKELNPELAKNPTDKKYDTPTLLEEINTAMDIVMNNRDIMLWRNFRTGTSGIQEYIKYSPKMDYNEKDLSDLETFNKIDKAYSVRKNLIREFRQAKKKNFLDGKQIKILDAFFQSATAPSIYNKTYADSTIEEIAKDIENKIEQDNLQKKLKKIEHKWKARLKDETRRIESKKEYPVVKSFEEFNNNLLKLKDLHTDTLGRAALDMAGINVPLYVKRNGNLIISGGEKCYGYCSRSPFGETIEVAIVDDPNDRIHSYKTTVHETMHAVLGETLDNYRPVTWGLRKRFEEGIVEIVAGSSTKEAYGKDYMNKNRRSYTPFVVDTLLRLKKTRRFKNQTLSQIGREIGRLAFEGDGKAINSIKSSLERSLKSGKTIYDVAKGYDDINKLEEATKRKYSAENNGDMTNFEKTELAMLIDRIKNTDFTLKDALETKGDIGFLATVLLYNILDEEDDELLGLL